MSREANGVQSIDHVTVVVADLAASRKFYVDALGMLEVERPAFSFDGMWLQAGATQVHFIVEHELSSPAGNPVPEEERGERTGRRGKSCGGGERRMLYRCLGAGAAGGIFSSGGCQAGLERQE